MSMPRTEPPTNDLRLTMYENILFQDYANLDSGLSHANKNHMKAHVIHYLGAALLTFLESARLALPSSRSTRIGFTLLQKIEPLSVASAAGCWPYIQSI